MRATRDLLRRRMPLRRTLAARLAPVQHTNRQYTLPELSQKIADTANRAGVAARLPDPAGQQRIAIDLALIGDDDPWRNILEGSIRNAATCHDAQPLSRRPAVPGSRALSSWQRAVGGYGGVSRSQRTLGLCRRRLASDSTASRVWGRHMSSRALNSGGSP